MNHGLLNPAHGSILPPLLAIIYSAPIRPSLSGGNKQRHVKKETFQRNITTREFFCAMRVQIRSAIRLGEGRSWLHDRSTFKTLSYFFLSSSSSSFLSAFSSFLSVTINFPRSNIFLLFLFCFSSPPQKKIFSFSEYFPRFSFPPE